MSVGLIRSGTVTVSGVSAQAASGGTAGGSITVTGGTSAALATGTVHPSSILRIDDDEERRMARDEFTDDLREIAKRLPRL